MTALPAGPASPELDADHGLGPLAAPARRTARALRRAGRTARDSTALDRTSWRRASHGLPAAALLADVVAAAAGVQAATWSAALEGAAYDVDEPVVLTAVTVVVWCGLLGVHHCYEQLLTSRSAQARGVLRAGATLALLVVLLAATARLPVSAAQVLALVAVTTAASAVPRLAGLAGRVRPQRTVLVGHRREVARVRDALVRGPNRVQVVAVCVPGPIDHAFGVPQTTGFDALEAAVVEHGADVVIVVPCRHLDPGTLRRLRWRLEGSGTALLLASGLLDVSHGRATVDHVGELPLLRVRPTCLRGSRRALVTVVERVLAVVALVVVAPVILACALAVRLDSPGPVLFRQVRVGRDETTFGILKLRTMVTDAEARLRTLEGNDADGVLFKLRVDPRVTRVGGFLRRWSLDELPQLVNVVLGQMSLVGPRPALPSEVAAYEQDTRRRLVVRPGITGLWQVSGRSELTWEEAVRLDLRYVDNWSIALDVAILVKTVRALVSHRGAF